MHDHYTRDYISIISPQKTFKCHVSLDQTPQIQCNTFYTVTLPSV